MRERERKTSGDRKGEGGVLTAPGSLTMRTFSGSCCSSSARLLLRCITVLFTPALGPIAMDWSGLGPADDTPWMGMIL